HREDTGARRVAGVLDRAAPAERRGDQRMTPHPTHPDAAEEAPGTAAPSTTPAPKPGPRVGRHLYWGLSDCGTIVRRDLTHLAKQPANIAWQLGFPIVSVLLFVFVFGSAMDVGPGV